MQSPDGENKRAKKLLLAEIEGSISSDSSDSEDSSDACKCDKRDILILFH